VACLKRYIARTRGPASNYEKGGLLQIMERRGPVAGLVLAKVLT